MKWRIPPIVVVCIAAVIYGGNVINNYDFRKIVSPPPRPKDVPPQAVWDGGAKEGSFILCDVDLKKNVNHCTIYHASSGIIWTNGDFQLVPGNRAARTAELNYAGYDGVVIHLTNGSILAEVPTKG